MISSFWDLCAFKMHFLKNVLNILMTHHALWYVPSKLPGLNRKYVNTGQNAALVLWSREVCNLKSGIDLACLHSTGKMCIAVQEGASTVVQTGARLWPPGRMERKSAFLLQNKAYLSWVSLSLNPSSVLSSAFICRTHAYTNPRRAAAVQPRRYSEGSWMDGWHLHALIECMFAQYFSAADGFIRHIDLEGR